MGRFLAEFERRAGDIAGLVYGRVVRIAGASDLRFCLAEPAT
jgi:hypothetical protein